MQHRPSPARVPEGLPACLFPHFHGHAHTQVQSSEGGPSHCWDSPAFCSKGPAPRDPDTRVSWGAAHGRDVGERGGPEVVLLDSKCVAGSVLVATGHRRLVEPSGSPDSWCALATQTAPPWARPPLWAAQAQGAPAEDAAVTASPRAKATGIRGSPGRAVRAWY